MGRWCWEKFVPNNPKSTWLTKKTINFELTLVSADRLPDVKGLWSGGQPMKVYAEVSLDGGHVKKSDVEGGTNPTWNFTVDYAITESTLKSTAGVNLIVGLFCKKSVGRSLIGKVKICVKSLFQMGLSSENDLGYRVEGTLHGNLSISYRFRVPNPLDG